MLFNPNSLSTSVSQKGSPRVDKCAENASSAHGNDEEALGCLGGLFPSRCFYVMEKWDWGSPSLFLCEGHPASLRISFQRLSQWHPDMKQAAFPWCPLLCGRARLRWHASLENWRVGLILEPWARDRRHHPSLQTSSSLSDVTPTSVSWGGGCWFSVAVRAYTDLWKHNFIIPGLSNDMILLTTVVCLYSKNITLAYQKLKNVHQALFHL